MRLLKQRVRNLEDAKALSAPGSGVWHQLIWNVGQSWDDLLASYGEERIKPGDNMMVIEVVDASDGKPLPDRVREQDRSKADAWLREQSEDGWKRSARSR
jgi:hypothetical protein